MPNLSAAVRSVVFAALLPIGIAGPPAMAQQSRPDAATGRLPDRGIGIIDFTVLPDSAHVADTIVFHAGPRVTSSARPIARWIRTSDHGHDVRHQLVGPHPIEPNLLEYGYEIVGLPYDSLSSDGRWARALLGVDSAGTMLRAWVRLGAEHVVSFAWSEVMEEKGVVYPLDPASAIFAASAGGTVVPALTTQYRAGEQVLEVLARQGPWLKVRFITADRMCGEPPPEEGTFTIAWIRFLADDGRPLVWYYTRGC